MGVGPCELLGVNSPVEGPGGRTTLSCLTNSQETGGVGLGQEEWSGPMGQITGDPVGQYEEPGFMARAPSSQGEIPGNKSSGGGK